MRKRIGEDDSRRGKPSRGGRALSGDGFFAIAWERPGEPKLDAAISSARFRSIVVPLDGSPFAEHALPWALAVARRTGARIKLVHVYVPLSAGDDPWDFFHDPGLADRLKERRQAYLHEVLERVARQANVPVSATLIEGREIAEPLSTMTAGADLVVMATHGRGRWKRLWSGSVATQLLGRLSVPLLLVRGANLPVDWQCDPAPRHILLPLDGSHLAEQILAPAIALGEPAGAEYTLLNVASHASEATPRKLRRDDAHEKQRGDAGHYLRRIADRLQRSLLAVGTGSVYGTMPVARAITDYATRRKIDLIAVTTGGRGKLARLWRASIADQLVQQTTTPVLVYRPPAVPEQKEMVKL